MKDRFSLPVDIGFGIKARACLIKHRKALFIELLIVLLRKRKEIKARISHQDSIKIFVDNAIQRLSSLVKTEVLIIYHEQIGIRIHFAEHLHPLSKNIVRNHIEILL